MSPIPHAGTRSRLAWAVTGSGRCFDECLAFMRGLRNLDLFVGKTAAEVVRMHKARPPDNIRAFRDTQARKCRIPIIVLACDTASELETKAPGGLAKVWPRCIDLENAHGGRG